MINNINYFYVCSVGVTYNKEKIRNIKKISLIQNNYVEIKKDIQLCTDFNPTFHKF